MVMWCNLCSVVKCRPCSVPWSGSNEISSFHRPDELFHCIHHPSIQQHIRPHSQRTRWDPGQEAIRLPSAFDEESENAMSLTRLWPWDCSVISLLGKLRQQRRGIWGAQRAQEVHGNMMISLCWHLVKMCTAETGRHNMCTWQTHRGVRL